MFEVGRVCVKLAGRDAGQKCLVVDVLDKHFVLVDGETRRRKVSVAHLLPLEQKVELKAKASSEEVAAACERIGLKVRRTTPKKAEARPRRVRKGRIKAVKKAKKTSKPKKVAAQ
ncbi:50S ribosomal protein L14e [Candidatus Woesearchaeota archaeon]|nr:50S ribosomal protein L14e [Candidatus Woesearchaeota archaeon]